MFQKWKAAEEELKEQAEENQREKEELLETARITDRQVRASLVWMVTYSLRFITANQELAALHTYSYTHSSVLSR